MEEEILTAIKEMEEKFNKKFKKLENKLNQFEQNFMVAAYGNEEVSDIIKRIEQNTENLNKDVKCLSEKLKTMKE